MDNKKCPLNNFEQCIGDDCAFHLGNLKIKIEEAEGNLTDFMPAFPCSFSITGTKSLYDFFGFKFDPSGHYSKPVE